MACAKRACRSRWPISRIGSGLDTPSKRPTLSDTLFEEGMFTSAPIYRRLHHVWSSTMEEGWSDDDDYLILFDEAESGPAAAAYG